MKFLTITVLSRLLLQKKLQRATSATLGNNSRCLGLLSKSTDEEAIFPYSKNHEHVQTELFVLNWTILRLYLSGSVHE
jgi:hypothetical protein